MMILDRRTGAFSHHVFSEFPSFLNAGDVLVLNDSRVIPARLTGVRRKTGGKVELLVLEEVEKEIVSDDGVYRSAWKAMMKTRGHPEAGESYDFAGGLEAVYAGSKDGFALVRFLSGGRKFVEQLEALGQTPLPPYIKRRAGADAGSADRSRYQTVYAGPPGAVAAPTAGLHFSAGMLSDIRSKGIEIEMLTLHVGAGTFLPVKTENLEDHKMHSERFTVESRCADAINRARAERRRIVAVGTTTVRTLESAVGSDGLVRAGASTTNLFIRPPYEFRVVDAMLTNFHLPCSTLLVLVSAFAGKDAVLGAYVDAVRNNYRFYSYGDCMFID